MNDTRVMAKWMQLYAPLRTVLSGFEASLSGLSVSFAQWEQMFVSSERS